MKIILASGSAARKNALDLIGLTYEVVLGNFDERSLVAATPEELTLKLAEAKAKEVGDKVRSGHLVIGGDMVTVFDGTIFHKPTTIPEANQMLTQLSGQTVQVVGAVAVYNTDTAINLSAVSICNVSFRDLNQAEIEDYTTRWPVLDYAAAFNGDGVTRFANRVDGAVNMATGFAISDLIDLLRQQGEIV